MQAYKNAFVYTDGKFIKRDLYVKDGVFCPTGDDVPACESVDFCDRYIFPGFADVHVHFREPGFSYKETIFTGTRAAAHGGYTAVCAMPNLSPVPDCEASFELQQKIVARDAAVKVYPYGAITVGQQGQELSDMRALSRLTRFFSDDGRGIQSESVMRSAMELAAKLGVMIAAHCENNAFVNGGCIREGYYTQTKGYGAIDPRSEWEQVARDLRLAKETGCKYHICHVSTKESAELVRRAKKNGTDVTAETAPHYLTLTKDDIKNEGRFKMNPPIGDTADREALREAVADGTVDMIATDHAPHSKEEKAGTLKDSLMGITGLETAFPVLYTALVKENIISLERLTELLSINPRKRFGLGGGNTAAGAAADFTVFDLKNEFSIDSESFLSKGKSTPFDKMRCCGKCLLTVIDGQAVWNNENGGQNATGNF